MGKAGKFKKLRKLASQLPAVNTRHVVGETMHGYDLPADAKIEGDVPLNTIGMYRRKKVIEVPLNHNRKLKQAYKNAGMQGAAQYANAVIQYTQSTKK